ncbi:MAG TPA: PIN domain-containing protein [Pseudonocardiaceae bacterium]|nr:PIN domain-containing protein [Pseudonocardiaceae bacterium]
MFTALLDTCVLWPSLQRDFLLSLAVEGMYRPVWSSVILEELEYEEAAKLISRGETEDAARGRARRLIDVMAGAFTDALVSGWEPLEGTYGLPDPNDEHVVAAAFVANAGVIVTHNVKDFPCGKVPGHIEVLEPHEFAFNTVALSPTRALGAVDAIVDRSGRRGGPLTVSAILDKLETRYGMERVVELLRQASA